MPTLHHIVFHHWQHRKHFKMKLFSKNALVPLFVVQMFGIMPFAKGQTCNICGSETPTIGDPSGVVINPIDSTQISCAELQQLGDEEELTSNQCLEVQNDSNVSNNCRCQPEGGWQPAHARYF
jgi:hypothetical protein